MCKLCRSRKKLDAKKCAYQLAGLPKRAIIARGSQWVPKDIIAISLSLSLSLAIVAVDTAENEPSQFALRDPFRLRIRGHVLLVSGLRLGLSFLLRRDANLYKRYLLTYVMVLKGEAIKMMGEAIILMASRF